MKNTDLNLELIDNLSDESIEDIKKHNERLKQNAGACILITKVSSNTIDVHVKNINGQRTSKVELLNTTYKILSDNIPEKYRILIKL